MGRRKEEWDVTECKIEAKDEVKEEAKEEMTMNRLHKMVTFGVVVSDLSMYRVGVDRL